MAQDLFYFRCQINIINERKIVMTLVKWTPKRNMFNISDEVEQMMHQAFGHSLKNGSRLSYSPLMNVSEIESDYLIMMDLPGVEKKDVDVNLSNGILTVSGERKTSKMGDENKRIWHETNYGTFSRSFELTSNIVEDKIKANFKDGVLNITIPKAEEIKPAVKTIAVS